jgi:RecJ-like exonuclease
MPEIDLASALETNVLKLGTMTMEAHADRLLVVQDPFVSGYECTTCGGKNVVNEVSYVSCEDCKGRGTHLVTSVAAREEFIEKKCSTCSGKGAIPCPACEGKGGLIVVPDASERRPTTGTIASVGDQIWCPNCNGSGIIELPSKSELNLGWKPCKRCKGTGGTKTFQRGQAVIYPSFAGHAYDLTAEDMQGNPVAITIVILRESEILAKISGHLEMRRVKKSAAMGTAA